jgi:hypothetical protein
MPEDLNTLAAWVGILLGMLSGIHAGLFFQREDWLGGYGSWPRRMLRLGHIAFFGIGLLNLGYTLTLRYLGWPQPHALASVALAASTFLMPLVCMLAAWRKPLRHLFVVPTSCLLAGVVGLLWARVGASV